MDLSRKVIFAACACAAFMAGIFSCTVEDRDLEEKGLFVCREDGDCLKDSICQGADKAKGIEGRCVRRDQMDPCLDIDEDGFFTAAPNAPAGTSCSFDKGLDPDDNDPTVFPDAPEYCDNKDNSGDGCVDGICSEPQACSGSDKSKCVRLYEFCMGPIDATFDSLSGTICDPKAIGMRVCMGLDAQGNVDEANPDHAGFVYAIPTADGYKPFSLELSSLDSSDYAQFYKDPSDPSKGFIETCPKSIGFKRTIEGTVVEYSENEEVENEEQPEKYSKTCKFDRDCDGKKGFEEGGNGCKECDSSSFASKPKRDGGEENCYVNRNGRVEDVKRTTRENCSSAKTGGKACTCFGYYSCTDKNGASSIGETYCNITVGSQTFTFVADDANHKQDRDSMKAALDSSTSYFDCENN